MLFFAVSAVLFAREPFNKRFKLLGRIIADIIGNEQEISEKTVYFCKKLSFLKGHFDIIISEEENIGIVFPRSAVKMAPENTV